MPHTRSKILTAALVAIVAGLQLLLAMPADALGAQVKLGAYTPYAPANGQVLDEYAEMVGRQPDIVLYYKDFFDPLMTEEQATELSARGETPMVTWEPSQPTSGKPDANLSDIASGHYDSYIREAARLVREYHSEVMIRFGHEMNISASLWGPGKDGNVGTNFVDAWRHIVTIFREEGATNAKWVWCPNVDWGGVPFEQYFPGDSWVDYVALDGYNWGTYGTEVWQSMSRLFASSYDTITRLSSKPVIFAKTSASEHGGNKADWIREGFLHAIPEQFPRVSAVIWFNAVDDNEDWRINTSPSALQAYREVVASSLYGGTEPAPTVSQSDQVSKIKSLTVTPTTVAKKGKKTTVTRGRRSPRVLYRVTRRASLRVVVRKKTRHGGWRGRRVTRIGGVRAAGSIRVSRLLGGRAPRRGKYLISASVMGGGGGTRRATLTVLPGASA